MKKKSNIIELSVQDLQTRMKEMRIVRKMRERDIDYSEIPEFSAKKIKKMKKAGRPIVGDSPRVAISIRLEADLLVKIKEIAKQQGVAYQSLINEILKKAV
jgi:uncharacterized protein (DUF4415 family)